MPYPSVATPAPAVPPLAALPGAEAAGLSPLPLGAAGSGAGMQVLQQFRELMAAQGHGVQVARMCFDRLYAYERIALAHAGSDPALRELALQLFQACHYGDPLRQAVS